MSLNYNFSYSKLADVYAVAEQEPAYKEQLLELATDLEQSGIGEFEGKEYLMNPDTRYPDEIISREDYELELEESMIQ